jgi:transposase
MLNGYEREFVYVYGAVSPREGDFDWDMCPQMNTQRMGQFLKQVARRYPREFIVMMVDGASSHRAKDLIIPENLTLLPLPAYSPELNPQEHIWDEVREKEFPNRVFDSLDGVKKQLRSGLARLKRDRKRIKSITQWPWIVTLNLKAH